MDFCRSPSCQQPDRERAMPSWLSHGRATDTNWVVTFFLIAMKPCYTAVAD
jgi:hypothetical protein